MSFKKFWTKISHLGVTDEMPVYQQKSTILYNQIVRLLSLLSVVISSVMYFALNYELLGILFFLIVPVLGFTLILNLKGKVHISVLFISLFFPIYILCVSVFTKLHGEGLDIVFFILPKVGIMLTTALVFMIIGLTDLKKSLPGTLLGILAFLFFNKIHLLFGLSIDEITYRKENFFLIQYVLAAVFLFIILSYVFLQKINTHYESILIDHKNKLEGKNKEITHQNEEITAQRDELEAQRNEIEYQRDEIVKKNHQITDSINYAKRIQKAIHPSINYLEEHLPEHFILLKPRDIVSGDFFWVDHIGTKILIAAADATGHGVPGAFMSMLGIAHLNELMESNAVKQCNAGQLLDRLREKMKNSLKQTGKQDEQKDGLDISLCILDKITLKMQYAGAHNPLYIVRNNHSEAEIISTDKKICTENIGNVKLIQYKADKQPIGIHAKERPFTNHEIQLIKGDTFYLFSDGFVDQFGGRRGDKFKTKRFKEILGSVNELPMKEQQQVLNNTFNTWKNDFSQLDDVLVVGVKV